MSAGSNVSLILAAEVDHDAIGEQGSGVEIVRLEPRGERGLLADLATGVERATGDLICYLGPGERLRDGAIAELARTIERQEAIVLAYPAYERLGESGEVLETVMPEEVDAWEILRLQRSPVRAAPMFRRAALAAALRPEPDFDHLRELVFWLRVMMAGEVRRNPRTLASRAAACEHDEAPGGTTAAVERIDFFERFVGDVQSPSDPRQGVLSAARNAFIAGSAEIPGHNDPGSRFFIVDRFAPEPPDADSLDPDATVALLEVRHAELEQRVVRQRATLLALREMVDIRESMLRQERSGEPTGEPLSGGRKERLRRRVGRGLKAERDGR